MAEYEDTKEREEFLREICETNDMKKVADLIERHYPGWVVLSLDRYSKDYFHLEKNWKYICEKLAKTTPKKILLVKHIDFTGSILNKLTNMLTSNGYCVRSANDIIACVRCLGAIPVKNLWENMKAHGMQVPEVWSPKCSNEQCHIDSPSTR